MPLMNAGDVNLFPEADIVNPALMVLQTKLLRRARNKSTLSYVPVATFLSYRAIAGKGGRRGDLEMHSHAKWSDYYCARGNSGEGSVGS